MKMCDVSHLFSSHEKNERHDEDLARDTIGSTMFEAKLDITALAIGVVQ